MPSLRSVAAIAVLTAVAGCGTEPAPPSPGAVSLWFSSLTGSGCAPTGNGKKQLPADVETLVARWTATLLTKAGTSEKKTGTQVAAKSALAAGVWDVNNIPVTDSLDLDVYGCSKDKQVAWIGRNTGLKVEEGPSQPARIFLAPIGKLACTGSPAGEARLGEPRSLAGSAVLSSGEVVIAGGVSTWNKDTGEGTAGKKVDSYDPRLGHFRAGPDLTVGRILPHIHAIGAGRQLLVVGGMASIKRLSTDGDKFVLQTLVPDKIETAAPAIKGEVVDLTAGTGSAKALKADINLGAGVYVLSSSIRLDKSILFVGGVAPAGEAQSVAHRLNNPEELGSGGNGKLDPPIDLNSPRVRPALLSFADGTVIAWGGAVKKAGAKAADQGELIGATATPLSVTGPAALVDDEHLVTIAPVAAAVARTDDVLTFLVAGGVPVKDPVSAAKAPTYLVTVTKSSKTAELRAVALPGDTKLRAGLFGVGVPLDGRRALIGLGLVDLAAPADLAGHCPKAVPTSDCAIDSAWVVQVPDPLGPADQPTQLSLVHAVGFGEPRFGVAAAPLPLGALVAGGQASTRSGSTALVLDDMAAVLTVLPSSLDPKTICN